MSETQFRVGGVDIEPRHVAGVALGAAVIAFYTAWMAADVVSRVVVFPIVALAAGFVLSRQTEPGQKSVYVGYTLSKLLVLTPFVFVLPDVSGDFTAGAAELALTVSNLILFVLFLLPAGLLA
ncbi:MAG: hypothetical protein ACI9K3_001654, partial [Halovenus sp.]